MRKLPLAISFLVPTILACSAIGQGENVAVGAAGDTSSRQFLSRDTTPEQRLAMSRDALAKGRYDDARALAMTVTLSNGGAATTESATELVKRVDSAMSVRVDSLRASRMSATRALSSMRRSHDEIRNVSFYFDKSVPSAVNSTSRMLLYIVKSDGGQGLPELRFAIRYVAAEWLFLESYTVKADDRVFTIDVSGYGDVERDNGLGGVWEWYDTRVTDREWEIVRAVIRSHRSVIRYNGKQYYHDRVISDREKAALRRVLEANEALLQQ